LTTRLRKFIFTSEKVKHKKNQNTDAIIDALSIDCLIFGFKKKELDILLVQHAEGISKGMWALPGGWI
jgi:ADP-ribose pyrophosphatase YjhB (NUDIX family)